MPPGRTKALTAIGNALEEIEAYFELNGFGPIETGAAGGASEEDGSEADEEQTFESDDESSSSWSFDREDIEVAIDVFISRLSDEHIIPKPTLRDKPSLLSVLERFFGRKHEVLEIARSFEKNIKGYFDIVSYDAMAEAHGDLLQIRDIIKRELKR